MYYIKSNGTLTPNNFNTLASAMYWLEGCEIRALNEGFGVYYSGYTLYVINKHDEGINAKYEITYIEPVLDYVI